MLQDCEDWQAETLNLDIPGIQAKERHIGEELKSTTLEAMCIIYPSDTWARVYTDRIAGKSVQDGGGEVFIKLLHGSSTEKCTTTWHQVHKLSSGSLNFASCSLTQEERLLVYTDLLTDCSPSFSVSCQQTGKQNLNTIWQELCLLNNRTSVTLQWIPSHSSAGVTEEADLLSTPDFKQELFAKPISYSKAKTVLRNSFRTVWHQRLNIGTEKDSIHHLDWAASGLSSIWTEQHLDWAASGLSSIWTEQHLDWAAEVTTFKQDTVSSSPSSKD